MNILFFLALFLTSIVGLVEQRALVWILFLSLLGMLYMAWEKKKNKKEFKPKSADFKELEKAKKSRMKVEDKKHSYIDDQIAYIGEQWGYTKAQEKIVTDFLEKRAYGTIYNKLSASLLPQMILLIENCNAENKKGCKRDVSARLRELTTIMKEELKKKKIGTKENFETTMEVYDYLMNEVK
jgi:hypothetical protein